MTTVQIIWLTVLLPVSIAVFVFAFIYCGVLFRRSQKHAFDVRSEFPFELMDALEPSLRMGRIYLIAWAALDTLVSAYLLVSLQAHQYLLVGSMVYAVAVLLRDVAFVFLFWIPAFHFKPHFGAFVSACGLTVFTAAVAITVCLNVRDYGRDYVQVPTIVFASVFGVLSLAVLCIMLNPKLANWAKLDSTVDESGAVVERRPKYFVLAFSEWLTVFLGIAVSILSIVSFVLFDLILK